MSCDWTSGCCSWIAGSGGGSGGAAAAAQYTLPETWGQEDIPAGLAAVACETLVSINFATFKANKTGSVIGLSTRLTEAVTAGLLTVRFSKNGVGGTLSLNHTNVLNSTGGIATQAQGIDTYVAGDLLGVEFTSSGGFLPTTSDLEATLRVAE